MKKTRSKKSRDTVPLSVTVGVQRNSVHIIVSLPQSTFIYRVPQCMSPRRNWDSPTPSLKGGGDTLFPVPRGGGQTRLLVRGWGSPDSDDWRKSCGLYHLHTNQPPHKHDIFYPFPLFRVLPVATRTESESVDLLRCSFVHCSSPGSSTDTLR
jgi:hypothetical protein